MNKEILDKIINWFSEGDSKVILSHCHDLDSGSDSYGLQFSINTEAKDITITKEQAEYLYETYHLAMQDIKYWKQEGDRK